MVYVPEVRNIVRIFSHYHPNSYEIKYQNNNNVEHELSRSCDICGNGGAQAIRNFGGSSKAAFLKLWSAEHMWSSDSALVVLLD